MTLSTLIMLIAGIGGAGILLGGAGVHYWHRWQYRRLLAIRRAEAERLTEAIGNPELGDIVRRLQDRGKIVVDELVWLVTASGVLIITIVVWHALERGWL